VFLDKLRQKGWLELFTNTNLGCSVPDLAEFYARCSVIDGRLISEVNRVKIEFDPQELGEILGIAATGFDIYVREDKFVLGKGRLVELAQKLSNQSGLKHPMAIKKGDMLPLHQLLFWFAIKNVIPRGQGRNQADAMDQYFVDLMDRGEPINLPAIMIPHIGRIATTTRGHDLGYGFLLTMVFEHFGVELQNKVGAQVINEIGNGTLMGCGFDLVQGAGTGSKQGMHTPPPPVSSSPSGLPTITTLHQEQQQLQGELSLVKKVLEDQETLNAKRHEDILNMLAAPNAKLIHPAP